MTEHGPFDIVVNNAGVDQHAFFTDTKAEDWARLIGVNLVSVLACTHAALPAMQAAGFGRIINITSEAARLGLQGRRGLFGGQGRRNRLHQKHRARERPLRHHGECHRAGADPHADAGTGGGRRAAKSCFAR